MQVDALVLFELVDDPADQHLVDIVAAEVRVAVGRFDLDDAFADLEDRDVERTAAKVEHGDDLVLFLVQAVRQSGRRRLVDDTQDLEPRDLAGVLGRLTLGVVKVCRHGNYGLFDLRAEIILGRLLQFLQDHRRDLGRVVLLAVDIDAHVAVRGLFDLVRHLLDLVRDLVVLAAHEPLDRIKRVLGVCHRLTLGDLADQTVAVLGKRHDRRSRPPALAICNDDRLAALHNRHDRIGRSQIDPYNFAHIFLQKPYYCCAL